MSSFTKPLTVTKLKSGMWKVEREFTYHVGDEKSKETITVPLGFNTDFASVPRLFWMILPPDGRYSQAAVLHDHLYSVRGKTKQKRYTRAGCDRIFKEAMKVLGVGFWKRGTMYNAVRSFGWIGWNMHARR